MVRIKWVIVIFIFFLIFPTIACGSDFRTGDRLVISKDEVVNDDLYFAGDSITVDGTINGDLITAGSDIKVNGIINGSLTAAAGSITVTGSITNDIRVAGGDIMIGGDVGDNVIVFGGNFILEKDATISRDLTIGVDRAVIDGVVNGNITGGARDMEMKGKALGDVTMEINENLNILPGATIGGNLEYTAPEQADISGTVSGDITYTEKIKEEDNGITGEILGYLWLLLIGILSLALAPGISQNITETIPASPLKNLLLGIMFLVLTPIFSILLLITIIGIPVSLIVMAVYIFEVYISRVFVGFWAGQYILKKLNKEIKSRVLILALGLLVVFIGINLPLLGGLIHLFVVILGLGAIVLTGYDIYRRSKEHRPV